MVQAVRRWFAVEGLVPYSKAVLGKTWWVFGGVVLAAVGVVDFVLKGGIVVSPWGFFLVALACLNVGQALAVLRPKGTTIALPSGGQITLAGGTVWAAGPPGTTFIAVPPSPATPGLPAGNTPGPGNEEPT